MKKITMMICASVVAVSCATAFAISGWSFAAFNDAMKKTGRNNSMSEKEFNAIQASKDRALKASEE
jgi:hypothetical protein